MYSITLSKVYTILKENHLLKEPFELSADVFNYLSYDSRDIQADTLFFCKGAHFTQKMLQDAVNQGVKFYLSEVPYAVAGQVLLVNDIRKSMALIAQAFYQQPQDKLYKVGITGTKGKTTTAYFVSQMLSEAFDHKVALFSSEETTLDGTSYFESKLTTPEALDLYRQMAIACENGIKYLVMEVSSQAYKTQRVFGLTFEIGVFLNISPDHISPIEHPTFEDYFNCKRQLLLNSKQMVINQDSDYFDVLEETCQKNQVPLLSYGHKKGDYQVLDSLEPNAFDLTSEDDPLKINGAYRLALLGRFNHENAAAALLVCGLIQVDRSIIQKKLPLVQVPGRMNLLEKSNGAYIFVDYAHNYLSIHSIGSFAKELRPQGKLIIVTGSAGGKALSRRPDIGKALSECADIAILTSDDPDFEDPADIAKEIKDYIKNPQVQVQWERDRLKAVTRAFEQARSQDTVVIAGKGTETMLKYRGKEIFYEGDFQIIQRLISTEKSN